MIILEILGFAAGFTNLVSSCPQLIANLKDSSMAKNQSASRNALQCSGNAFWLAYGLSIGSVAMTTFSTLGCLMAGALLWQVISAKRTASVRLAVVDG